jgi:DNA-binding NarL/FixJ family response regulator
MTGELRPRVLLADDYAGILSALARLLEPSCEIVGKVADGRALLEAAERLAPDVVVLDLSMPELNGLDACQQLKAAMPAIKIVMLTAATDDGLRRSALRMGADAFVGKHAIADALPGAIRTAWLGRVGKA